MATSSASIAVATTSAPVPPTAITGVASSNVTQTSFTISWSGGTGATSYTFTFNGSPKTEASLNGNSANFTGLTMNRGYSIVITGTNAGGSVSSNAILVSTLGGSLQVITKTTLSNSGYGIVFDSAGQNFYTCYYRPSEIWKVTYPGFSASRYASWDTDIASNLIGLTMDTAGNLYVTDNARENMWKVTAQDTYTLFAPGPSQCCGIGQDGYMYAVSRNTVLRISSTGSVQTISSGGYQSLTSGKMGPDGKVYVIDCNGYTIYKMNSDGSGKEVFASGLDFPWDMCFDAQGNVYVATARNTIIAITAGGQKSTYAGTGNQGTTDGPLLNATIQINGIVIGPDGNLWFTNAGNLIRLAEVASPLQAVPLNAFTGT